VTKEYKKNLDDGLSEIGMTLSPEKIEQLLRYHQLLIKWNKAYNLTAVRNPEEMISRHLLDSLIISPFIEGKRFLDVGTGAGLPGIVLAITFPDRQFDLLDSNGKKTRFLFQVKTELGLKNIDIFNARVEQHQIEQPYDGIFSRAFATLQDMLLGSQHLLAQSGHYYAMKGIYPDQELSAIEKDYMVNACHSLDVPGADGQRHLVVIKNRG
jgi:16S rRNA (guanine527-N7)-methyltransferase